MPAALRERCSLASAFPCSCKLCCSTASALRVHGTVWTVRSPITSSFQMFWQNSLVPPSHSGLQSNQRVSREWPLSPKRPGQRPCSGFLSGVVPPKPFQRCLRICPSHPMSDSDLPSERQSAGQSCHTRARPGSCTGHAKRACGAGPGLTPQQPLPPGPPTRSPGPPACSPWPSVSVITESLGRRLCERTTATCSSSQLALSAMSLSTAAHQRR